MLLCWLALHCVPQAHAERPPSCEQDAACWKELNRASKLAESGQYAEALSVFEAAYARVPDPRLQINIGRSLHRLGRYDDAVAAFQQYQATARASAPPQEQEVVRRFIAEAQLAKLQASQPQTQPPPPPPEKPIYKKWSFKKFFASDGDGCWNGSATIPDHHENPPPRLPELSDDMV